MRLWSVARLAAACLGGVQLAAAIELDPDSPASIKAATGEVAKKLMSFYTGNKPGDTPGYLPDPYYWWEAGAMFGAMIDYWYYTNDTTYNDIVEQALVHQAGDDRNYMPINASKSMGNDDQGFWGMTAMMAAERNFQNPPKDQPQWLALAQAVFSLQSGRWDDETCGGGLKWQVFVFNKGYDYKNSISNGAMFNIASRLAVYTGNATYAKWAEKTWDWVESVGLINEKGDVFDGSSDLLNCTELDHTQWSYNAGIWLHGAANMYKFTNNSEKWLERSTRILDKTTTQFFWKDTGIMYEPCEASPGEPLCNIDQMSFKAYLSRWLGATTRLIPELAPKIMPLLTTSALAAARQCMPGAVGAACGLRWYEGSTDGREGVGQQMSAMDVMGALLVTGARDLVTNKTGGTSLGDYGDSVDTAAKIRGEIEVTTAGRAAAGMLTAAMCGLVALAVWFMVGPDGGLVIVVIIVECGMDSSPCSGSKSDSGVSLCCVPGDTCGADSICHFTRRVENASGFYLGGCTDPTFQDPLCAGQCSESLTSDIVYNPSTNLWSCCGYPNGTKSCQDPTSDTFLAISPDKFPGTAILSSTPSSSSSSSSSSTPLSTPSSTTPSTSTNSPSTASTPPFHEQSTTTPPPSSQDKSAGLSTGVKAGIGIACAVAAIAIAGAVFLLMRRGKSYKKGSQMPQELDTEKYRDQYRVLNRPELDGTMVLAELSSARKVSELDA
ncbi:hypothetical protein V497_08286 [Pseudogymnoascus sp. VKM F-4516 (FW-969)]|nr:hypothetical protein V497_08286 [Pseudogymnoascus sp. VKM F-4516 (FW-969)]